MPGKPYPENESEVQYEEWNRFRGPIDLSSHFAYPLLYFWFIYQPGTVRRKLTEQIIDVALRPTRIIVDVEHRCQQRNEDKTDGDDDMHLR